MSGLRGLVDEGVSKTRRELAANERGLVPSGGRLIQVYGKVRIDSQIEMWGPYLSGICGCSTTGVRFFAVTSANSIELSPTAASKSMRSTPRRVRESGAWYDTHRTVSRRVS